MDIKGYFQSYKYMEGYNKIIIDKLTPQYNFDGYKGTSIHVRRGDYLIKQHYHPILEFGYYNEAMKICKSDKYYIFSDDIAWCKNNFIGPKFEFIENNHETLDMAIQSKCENNIIANSSFSLWSAMINKNPNKIVIAPKHWFGNKVSNNTKDLIPENWITI
jgi:Glycosyl transferase family 11